MGMVVKQSPKLGISSILGLGHGLSDASAGYILSYLLHDSSLIQAGSGVMIYNLLAFGGQIPIGIWLDHIGRYRTAAWLSLLGMGVAILAMVASFGLTSIVLAGICSAIYHVAGGAITLTQSPGKAQSVGVFSAFGVIGLALGGTAGAIQWYRVSYLLLAGLGSISYLLLRTNTTSVPNTKHRKEQSQLDHHDYLMILLLVAIACRSALWNIIQCLYAQQYVWLVYIALAAMVGKLVGGWLADRIPWKPFAFVAMSIAIPALGWGYRKLFWLMLGTGLLQSLTPISVVALHRLMPNVPATVSGAVFGFAIALGGVISMMPVHTYFTFFSQVVFLGVLTWALYYSFFISSSRFMIRNVAGKR